MKTAADHLTSCLNMMLNFNHGQANDESQAFVAVVHTMQPTQRQSP
jgi:hypothetical protein